MTLNKIVLVAAALMLVATPGLAGKKGGGSSSGVTTIGKNPGKVKGRWLRVHDAEALSAHARVAIGSVATDIHWKNAEKETPIDERLLDDRIRARVLGELSGLYAEVLEGELAEGEPGLRLDCDLLVEPGNRAVRYMVGFGAGKSKSIFEIDLRDNETNRLLAEYHGYGVGSGMALKLVGGGARKMTQDDIQENALQLATLLGSLR